MPKRLLNARTLSSKSLSRRDPRLARSPTLRGLRTMLSVVALLLPIASAVAAPAQRIVLATAPQRVVLTSSADRSIAATGAVDAGPLAGSQPITLTLRVKQTPAQTAALDALLADQTHPASPLYQKWLTPATYAESFGASDADVATLTSWLQTRGLAVTAISPSRSRLTVTGDAAHVESAFAVPLHRMATASALFFANTAPPSVPAAMASLIEDVAGLDDLPTVAASRITIATGANAASPAASAHIVSTSIEPDSAPALVQSGTTASADPLAQLASLVDANTSAVVTLASTACLPDLSSAEIANYRALLRQANAQGMTILATSACASNTADATQSGEPTVATAAIPAFPAALAEVTAITISPRPAVIPATTAVETRPAWQAALGLPADTLRHEPDLTTSSAGALAQTVTTLNQQVGHRVGNLNPALYSLASTPDLFTQPDATISQTDPARQTSSAGNWQASTGLGTINLKTLLKVFPHATTAPISTITGVQSSSYGVNYGDSFTLTARVVPASYGTANPTGTVTFSASSQGNLGSATIDGSGNATLIPGVLPSGRYTISAVYSGDALYTGSSSTISATVTISPVNAKLAATIAPAVKIPYGAVATVTATVTLPGANASPSGPVFAQISSGSPASAILSPNPGSNSATANIDVSVPPPGGYNVQVTCLGTADFQCQTPVNLPITTVKGYTLTTVSVTPAAPQAGQPISLTATVVNSGNGTASYTFSGSISFYDSGKLLATAPVATNQATTVQALSGNRTHNITAIYTGDANWNASSSGAVAVTPTILPDDLTLASTVNTTNSLAGVNIIFTATTTTTITYGTGPTGTITFFDTFNGAVVQLGNPATLVANGPTASIGLFTSTGLLPGMHHIYAQYSGDGNYAPATSAVLVLSLSDFTLAMTPTSLSLAQGTSQQVTVFVGESGGFAGTVSLGCTPPASSLTTCNFAPASVTGGGATTLTITTTAASAATSAARPSGLRSNLRSNLWPVGTGASLASLLLFVLPRRRRALPALLSVLFAAGLLSASLGCGLSTTANAVSGSSSGAGSAGSTPNNGTPFGTQNFVIVAAGSDGVNTIRHTYQYQVTVQ